MVRGRRKHLPRGAEIAAMRERLRASGPWENMTVALTFLALLIELAVGYPDRLLRAIGHPVTWIGRLIGLLDRLLNHESTSSRHARAAAVVGALS